MKKNIIIISIYISIFRNEIKEFLLQRFLLHIEPIYATIARAIYATKSNNINQFEYSNTTIIKKRENT